MTNIAKWTVVIGTFAAGYFACSSHPEWTATTSQAMTSQFRVSGCVLSDYRYPIMGLSQAEQAALAQAWGYCANNCVSCSPPSSSNCRDVGPFGDCESNPNCEQYCCDASAVCEWYCTADSQCASGGTCRNGDCCYPDPLGCTARCGDVDDGCGHTLHCGDCAAPFGPCNTATGTCCVPQCNCGWREGDACGQLPNGCGGTCDCSDCGNTLTCVNGTCRTATSSACGDGTCDTDENCSTCPDDCGTCGAECGNGTCESGEDCSTCPGDCGTCGGGDGGCEKDEDCAAVVGAEGVCSDGVCFYYLD
jgi:hypothetical protein